MFSAMWNIHSKDIAENAWKACGKIAAIEGWCVIGSKNIAKINSGSNSAPIIKADLQAKSNSHHSCLSWFIRVGLFLHRFI